MLVGQDNLLAIKIIIMKGLKIGIALIVVAFFSLHVVWLFS